MLESICRSLMSNHSTIQIVRQKSGDRQRSQNHSIKSHQQTNKRVIQEAKIQRNRRQFIHVANKTSHWKCSGKAVKLAILCNVCLAWPCLNGCQTGSGHRSSRGSGTSQYSGEGCLCWRDVTLTSIHIDNY